MGIPVKDITISLFCQLAIVRKIIGYMLVREVGGSRQYNMMSLMMKMLSYLAQRANEGARARGETTRVTLDLYESYSYLSHALSEATETKRSA
jgi:hypothetical protein